MGLFSQPTRQRRTAASVRGSTDEDALPQHRRPLRELSSPWSFFNRDNANRLVIAITVFAFMNALVLWTPNRTKGQERNVEEHLPYHSLQTTKKISSPFSPPITPRDMEVIPHPATLYGATLPEGASQTLNVPKFWKPPHLKLNGRLMSKEVAKSIGSFWKGHRTIFVAIASYRDPDCVNTVQNIYSRAAVPERIRTVVVEQVKDGDTRCTQPPIPCESNPEHILCQYRHLIESYEMDARLAVGPTFARHIAHRHYRGEYFAMQVDSHVRFTQHFDDDLLNQWRSAQNEMAVLSTYLLDLNGAIDQDTHQSKKPTRALMCNVYFEGTIIKNGQQAARPVNIHGKPTIHPFWAAGFSFARGHFVTQVPYDGYLPMVFQGEEISMTVRAFTFGYDFYAPERNVCFHMYALNKNREARLAVPLFSENRKPFKGVEEQAMKRLTTIIELNDDDPVDYVDLEQDKYGLGRVRSPQMFYKTFGIHTDSQTMENHLCWFVGEQMQRRFLPHMSEDGMGIDYDALNYEFQDPAPDQD